jgi:tripartite-type tricarboxylate transporter receptor subunit TctC
MNFNRAIDMRFILSVGFRRAVILGSIVFAAGATSAQSFPLKPVTLQVPYPAGGLADAMARIVERPLSKALGQTVIVENLGGAAGALAAQKALNAAADGHLIFQGSPNEVILAPLAIQAARYRSEDFRMVQIIGVFPMAVVARKELPATNIDELAALAKKADAEGKPLTYASVGVGSYFHLLGENFAQQVGARMTHVPYRGGAALFQDIAGGQVDLSFIVVGSPQIGMIDQGRMKIIGTMAPAGKVELPFLKQYPSINDSKVVRDFAYNMWTGYFVKKDTPEPVVQALNKAFAAAMSDPDVHRQLEQLGGMIPPMVSTAEAAKEYAAQTARFRAIAKSIKLEAQ